MGDQINMTGKNTTKTHKMQHDKKGPARDPQIPSQKNKSKKLWARVIEYAERDQNETRFLNQEGKGPISVESEKRSWILQSRKYVVI